MADEVVMLVTAGSPEEAEKISRALVDGHLAACVNIVAGVRSFFFWEGRTQEASETLLICKSRLALMDRFIACVTSLHSYSVPEIIALPVAAGLPAYLRWVDESTRG